MKKRSLLLLLCCFAGFAKAATSITTPTVSGDWTLANSPYLIYNTITVNSGQSLRIEPGVQVIFQGYYKFHIDGILYAAGTSGQYISFTVADTTGFAASPTTNAGSWMGMDFGFYTGTATDTSALAYCNISYIKYDAAAVAIIPFSTPVNIQRGLTVNNCNIFKCASAYLNLQMVNLQTYAGQTIEFGNCNIYDNNFNGMIFEMADGPGGNISIHDNTVYQNTGSEGIFNGALINLSFVSNDVYQNDVNGPSGAIGIVTIDGITSKATLKGNKIHDNITNYDGAIMCYGGRINIIGNLVCNNWHLLNTGCGLADGGGAMNLSGNLSDTTGTSYFVMNNILANNYSPFHGGGISVFKCIATIINNDIINNSANTTGGIYVENDTDEAVTIRNNILDNNASSFAPFGNVAGIGFGPVNYEYNWSNLSYYNDVSILYATITGDSTKQVIGASPGLISPTLTSSKTETALSSDFRLRSTSPCIDKGDNSVVPTGSTDYLGNARIIDGTVDIGAIEYTQELGTYSIPVLPAASVDVYPNPAEGSLTVNVPQVKGSIHISDVSGKTILEKNVTDNITTIDTHAFPRGLYFIIWRGDAGLYGIQKVILQ